MELMNSLNALLFVPMGWAMCAGGRQINRWICPKVASEALDPVERMAFGLASGAIVAAQGILVLGLLGQLRQMPVATLFGALALLGIAESLGLVRDFWQMTVCVFTRGWAKLFEMFAFVVIALAAVSGCFLPPISAEWDSLSYHLADPKIYVAAHRIIYIPWESHSNFAFNMEMLYCVGLLYGSIPLAKLFAFKLGALAVVGVYFIGKRVIRMPGSGFIAALIFATMPLAFWEAGTAYVDLAATSFAALGLLALVIMARTGESRFACLAGVMLGGMLGIKATALVTIALYAVGIIAHARVNSPGAKQAARRAIAMVAIAVVVGGAWYVKSYVYTGNPVYPFATSIFGGRNWDLAQSAAYSSDQHSFGMGHRPSDLLLAPWNLTMFLVPGHLVPAGFPKPFNDYQTLIASLSPLFVIVLIAGLMMKAGPPRRVRLLIEYCAIAFVVWFYLTQQVRYLLPVTPVLCVVAESILRQLASRSTIGRSAAAISIVCGVGFNLLVDGIIGAQDWATVAGGPGALDAYVSRGLESYDACMFINRTTSSDDKVITYGEPRTFYLDREHMWGETGHSTVVPYASFSGPQDLRRWLIAHGFHTILIDTQYADVSRAQPGWPGMVAALTVDSGKAPLYQQGDVYVYGI